MTAGLSVLVVGGGVVGLACARAAARAGHRVTLLAAPRGLLPEAAGLPAALLNPYRGRRGAAHPADVQGLMRTWAWAAELRQEGFDPGVRLSSVLRIPDRAGQADAWRTQAAADSNLTFLTAPAVDARVHAPYGAMVVHTGGWLKPDAHLAALQGSFERSGGRTLDGVAAAVTAQHGRWGVRGDGLTLEADVVLLATGAAQPPALPAAAQAAWPALELQEGDVHTVTAAGLDGLPPVAGGSYAAFEDGVAFVGGGHRTPCEGGRREGEQATGSLAHADLVGSHVAWAVPAVRDGTVQASWSGVRAKAAGGRPVLKTLAPRLTAAVGFAGRGFLVAAHAAEVWAGRLGASDAPDALEV